MLVGIPALLLFVVTIWAVPLALLGLVTTALSGRWSTLAAVASLVLYFAAVTVGLGLLRRGVLSPPSAGGQLRLRLAVTNPRVRAVPPAGLPGPGRTPT